MNCPHCGKAVQPEARRTMDTAPTFDEWFEQKYPKRVYGEDAELAMMRVEYGEVWHAAQAVQPESGERLSLDRDQVKCIADELHAFAKEVGPSNCGASVGIGALLDAWLVDAPRSPRRTLPPLEELGGNYECCGVWKPCRMPDCVPEKK